MAQPEVRIVINRAGVREVARSSLMRQEMERRASLVKATAEGDKPPGQALYMTGFIGQNRARASVMAPGGLAKEQETRYLGRAIDAARG
jgi:hypothetical protein